MSKEKSDGLKKSRRGVRASSEKLYKALVVAGIKTQAELAERIANKEGLENPPRSLVNKIFKEKTVDVASLERVASILGTEAWKLYLDSASENRKTSNSEKVEIFNSTSSESVKSSPSSQSKLNPPFYFLVGVSFIVVLSVLFYMTKADINGGDTDSIQREDALEWDNLQPNFGQYSIVFVPQEEDLYPLVDVLNKEFSGDFRVPTKTAMSMLVGKNRSDITRLFDVDLVVFVSKKEVGRRYFINISLAANGKQEDIYNQYGDLNQFSQSNQETATAVKNIIDQLIIGEKVASPVSADAFWEYLKGKENLDSFYMGESSKVAQAHFYAALRMVPDFPLAHAGLCEAIAHEAWQDEEASDLLEAKAVCEKAMNLASESAAAKLHFSWYLLLSGQQDIAIEQLERMLVSDPDLSEARALLAESYLQRYYLSEKESDLEIAYEKALDATDQDASYWKSWVTRGRITFARGDVDGAIDAFEKSAERGGDFIVLGNLGNLYFCRGELQSAGDTFQRMIQLKSNHHLGHELLATFYFFNKQFEQSTRAMNKSISLVEKEANLAAKWYILAESYRFLGRNSEAIGAYKEAIKINEKDRLLGRAVLAQEVSVILQSLRLRDLDTNFSLPESFTETWINEKVAGITSMQSMIHAAAIKQYFNHNEEARAFLQKAIDVCPVYAQYPGLDELIQ